MIYPRKLLSMELKNILKKLLKDNDISVAKLSRVTKIPRQTIDNWLSGQEPRSLSQVKIVAEYFDISIDQLCFGVSQPQNPIIQYENEIRAGVFEVILRKVKS